MKTCFAYKWLSTTIHIALATSALVGSVMPASRAYAFSEDLCVTTGTDGRRHFQNCLDAKSCDPQYGDTSQCRANLVWDGAKSVQLASRDNDARSMLHVDSTFFIAQAVGFSPEAAYWIAAYDELTDVGVYRPLGMDSTRVDTWQGMPTRTATLNGWKRTSTSTGGFLAHIPAPFTTGRGPGAATYSGLHPDVEDLHREGMLVQLRDWVMDDGLTCADGFTTFKDGYPFGGSTCFEGSPVSDGSNLTGPSLYGHMPSLTTSSGSTVSVLLPAYSGEQVARYDEPRIGTYTPVNPYTHGAQTADELEDILSATYSPAELQSILQGRELGDLEALARMGIYIHLLQDRISHHPCSDKSSTTFIKGDLMKSGVFNAQYDSTKCSQGEHAYDHYLEVGTGQSLPARTGSALTYTYRELMTFRSSLEDVRSWWGPNARANMSLEIPDRMLSDLLAVLRVKDACLRTRAMIELTARYGFEQMPGNIAGRTATMCR